MKNKNIKNNFKSFFKNKIENYNLQKGKPDIYVKIGAIASSVLGFIAFILIILFVFVVSLPHLVIFSDKTWNVISILLLLIIEIINIVSCIHLFRGKAKAKDLSIITSFFFGGVFASFFIIFGNYKVFKNLKPKE